MRGRSEEGLDGATQQSAKEPSPARTNWKLTGAHEKVATGDRGSERGRRRRHFAGESPASLGE